MSTPREQAARLAELLLSPDPDTAAQGLALLDSEPLPEAAVIDALIGPQLFERFADRPPTPPVPLALWDRLPGLGAALRAAPLPDSVFLFSPLATACWDAFGASPLHRPCSVLDRAAWEEAEALRERLGLPLPFAALIEYDRHSEPGLSALQNPYDALHAIFPDDWPRRLRRWMADLAARAGRSPEAQAWLSVPDDALTLEHIVDGAVTCVQQAAARAAAQEDESFGGAQEALERIEGCRQEGALWAMLGGDRHRWPLALPVMSQRLGFDRRDWIDDPAVAFWVASPGGWRRRLREWACDCAGHVADLCRADPRPHAALAATRALLAGEGSRAAWRAACDGAADAAGQADAEVQRAIASAGLDGPGVEDLEARALAARGSWLAARGSALRAAQVCARAAHAGVWEPFVDERDWQRERLWERLRAT